MITEDTCKQLSLTLDVAAEVWMQHLNFVCAQPASLHLDVLETTHYVHTGDRNSVAISFSLSEAIDSWLPGIKTRPGGMIYLTIAQADALREQLSLIVAQAWDDDGTDPTPGDDVPKYKTGGNTVPSLMGEIAHTLETEGFAGLFRLREDRVRAAAIACRMAQEALNNLSAQEAV